MVGQRAVAPDVTAAHAALVVGGVEQRGAETLEGGLHGIAVGARHRADDGVHLVAPDQGIRPLDGRLGIGLGVGDHDLEAPATEHAPRVVRLLEGELRALHTLIPQRLQSAGQRLQDADLDGLLLGPDNARRAEQAGRAERRTPGQHLPARYRPSNPVSRIRIHGCLPGSVTRICSRLHGRPSRRPSAIRPGQAGISRLRTGVPSSSALTTSVASETNPKWVAMS